MDHLCIEGPVTATATGFEADLDHGWRLQVDLLADGLLRVAVLPRAGLVVDRVWTLAPQRPEPTASGSANPADIVRCGRPRLSVDGFDCPPAHWDATAAQLKSPRLTVRLQSSPLALRVHRSDDPDAVLCEDRATGAYLPRPDRGTLRHYQLRPTGIRHLGLGDASGPLDRSGRRLRCEQIDALGYDAETSNPLYKHAPWLILERAAGACAGLLYETLADVDVDLGAEHSNYHAPYRCAEIAECGVVWYLLDGPRLSDLIPRLHGLVGRPPLPPRWALGFGFTSMHHADAGDAQRVIGSFAEAARARRMPVSSIHFGSGYSSGPDGRRYVFTWNEGKFPDRAALFARLRELGFRTVANVKPALLTEHPEFADCVARERFVRRADGSPAITRFWGGAGASLDFTRAATIDWWRMRLRTRVLDAGFDGIWNDNNEAELADCEARVTGDDGSAPLPAMAVRPLHALLMTRASRAEQRRARPDERPHTISRAGPMGIGHSAETWTGDNRTSWHTLRWNLANGLSMSLSGMPLVGHDIGGFTGPRPDPELLVRWFQMMALHPRAVMNSWKQHPAPGEDPASTPWMHPEVEAEVRAALELRCRYLPWLYQCCWQAHRHGHPVIAPVDYWLDGQRDPQPESSFMLGDVVLVLPVMAPGERAVERVLPAGADWFDPDTDERHAGGSEIALPAPLGKLPLLIRAGSILPLADAWPDTAPHDANRVTLHLWPGAGSGRTTRTLLFDDGISWGYQQGDASLLQVDLAWDDQRAEVRLTETGTGRGRPALDVAWHLHEHRETSVMGLDELTNES